MTSVLYAPQGQWHVQYNHIRVTNDIIRPSDAKLEARKSGMSIMGSVIAKLSSNSSTRLLKFQDSGMQIAELQGLLILIARSAIPQARVAGACTPANDRQESKKTEQHTNLRRTLGGETLKKLAPLQKIEQISVD